MNFKKKIDPDQIIIWVINLVVFSILALPFIWFFSFVAFSPEETPQQKQAQAILQEVTEEWNQMKGEVRKWCHEEYSDDEVILQFCLDILN